MPRGRTSAPGGLLVSRTSTGLDREALTPALSGFEDVKRFYDPRLGLVTAKILPGEFYVTASNELVSTLLGSCVSACIWDPEAGVGGMNHFMIPDAGPGGAGGETGPYGAARYGLFAMEFLINAILSNGGRRDRLKVKLAGGGEIIRSGGLSIGEDNVAFARSYVAAEGLDLVADHLLGTKARRVVFHPLSGRCKVSQLTETVDTEVAGRERNYAAAIRSSGAAGGIELF